MLADQLRLLTAAIRQSDRDDADREMATEPDAQGIGVAVNGATSPRPDTTGHGPDRTGSLPAARS